MAIAPNQAGAGQWFTSSSPIGFTGPDSSQPLVQTGANVAGTYVTSGGIGGPNLPRCNPPPGFIDATTTLHVVTASRAPSGNWNATLLTGTYEQTAGLWTCQGGVGVRGAVEHVTLEAVPGGEHLSATRPDNVLARHCSRVEDNAHQPGQVVDIVGSEHPRRCVRIAGQQPRERGDHARHHPVHHLPFAALQPDVRGELRGDPSHRVAPAEVAPKAASRGRRVYHRSMRSALIFAVVLLVGATLGGLNDPKFGFNGRSVATYVAVVLAILIGVAVSAAVNSSYRRARGRAVQWQFHALPAGLLVAATCVLISRLSQFQPGYLYGVIVGIAFGGTLTKEEAGYSTALGTLVSLVVAVLAWFAWVPVHTAAAAVNAGFVTVVASDLLASLFIGGLVGSVIGLLPLNFLPGGTLISWKRWVWASVFGLAVFGLLEIELRPQSTAAHPGSAPMITAIVLFVLFGGVSVGMRMFFSRRERGPAASTVAP